MWDSVIACGGGPTDLLALENGEYPRWFQAMMVAYNRGKEQIKQHGEDAVASKYRKK